MTMRWSGWVRPAVATLVLMTSAGCQKVVPAITQCIDTAAGAPVRRVLIFGESWATDRFALGVAKAAGQGVSGNVRICAVAYYGMNTGEQRYLLEKDYRGSLTAVLGGAADHALLLTGVNDVVQHVGADVYARNTRALAGELLKSSAVVYIPELSLVNTRVRVGALSFTKRAVNRLRNDGGAYDPHQAYRAALAARLPGRVHLLDVDAFSRGYPADKASFDPGGIHFLPPRAEQFGMFLERAVRAHADQRQAAVRP
jgi:hypothetical protein